jgi:hypothetical protein
MLWARSFAAMSAEPGAEQVAARNHGIASAHGFREVVNRHGLGGPDAVPGFVLMKLVPGLYSADVGPVAENVDLSARLILAVEPVPELSGLGFRLNVRHGLIISGFHNCLNLLRVRVRVLEQRDEIRVLRKDAPLECRLSGVSVMIASRFRRP